MILVIVYVYNLHLYIDGAIAAGMQAIRYESYEQFQKNFSTFVDNK